MKSRIFRKVVSEHLVSSGNFSKCSEILFLISAISFRRSISSSNALHRLLCVNNLQGKFNTRNCSKWSPNVIKSPVMNYPIPDGTLVDSIWSRVDQWADRTALVCGITGREMKYCELQDVSKRVATALLTDVELTAGQVIATILPNIFEYPPILLGAFDARMIVTTINPMNTADEIAAQLKSSGAVAAVTFPDKLPTLMEVFTKLNYANFKIIVTPNIDGSTMQQTTNNVIHYSELVSKQTDHEILDSIKAKSVSPDDTTLIPYSSGTSGKPKGVCLTHKNLLANNANRKYVRHIWDTTINFHKLKSFGSKIKAALPSGLMKSWELWENLMADREHEETAGTHQDVVPLPLPIFHAYGLTVVLFTSLFCGAKLITLPKFEEPTFLKALKDYKSTVLYLAPPLILYLGNSPSVTKEHLSSLRTIVSGAAPTSGNDIQKCIKKSSQGLQFVQGYGLTETSPCICCVPDGLKPPNLNTVGIPAPNTKIKVIDLQTGQPLGANEEGEICVKGPQVMKGYLNNPEATDECIDSSGWFHTGDIGYYDEQKFFYITDRLKELIKVQGFQVAPSELEAVIRDHPDVQDAGVIGVPDAKLGEVPVAFVQSKIKDENVMVTQLKKHLHSQSAKYKHVSKYFFVDSIPKSATGKILRKDLKKLYLSLTAN